MERIKGVMFRSKAKWYEEGEKNTKYFYSPEKAKYNAKTCYRIIDEQGNELRDSDQILEMQRRYYTELYQEDTGVNFSLVNSTNVKVPKGIQEQQNKQLCMKDLETAIKGMKNNKTPGPDGIPVDFYKVFWAQLKDIFYQVVMQAFQAKLLHETARKGILNLIPKPGKDSKYIKNLRPITLLNTDYKIIEKAIANKMLPALEHIIHTDQRGFMKDRRISVNIRKMLDIIHQVEKEDLEAVILSLDFVKCFDKCSFSILYGSLDFFGFGEIVKEWTRVLYKDYEVNIQNNGHFSRPIEIKKGVHQGGCCSSVYFLVIAEILAMALRANDRIQGITIKDIKNILNQFADDMDVFSMCTESSIRAIYSELEDFRLQSGFTVSYEKTTLYRIGSLRHSNAQLYGLDQFIWSNKDISVLGVTIAHEDIMEKNYMTIVEKSKKVLNSWQNRDLSLVGKVQVINTLISSLFVYKMMVLPEIPKNVVKNMNNIIREYLWNGKKSKIAYNILQLTKNEGGLNLVSLVNKDKALKATWPYILSTEQDYSELVYALMHCSLLGTNIWRCTLHPEHIKYIRIENPFWKDVLVAWCSYNYYQECRIENQYIWYNSHILIGGKPIMWGHVVKKGLMYVHQLYVNQQFKSLELLQTEFGLTILSVNSLKAAIPQEWKRFFEQTPPSAYIPIPPHNYDIHLYDCSFSRKVYKFLLDDVVIMHHKYLKWRQELGSEFCEAIVDFREEHINIYKVTNIAKYRSFQYRILQRALVTNIQLEKWNIVSNNSCFYCKNEPETVIHLLWFCPIVQEIWTKVLQFLSQEYSVPTDGIGAREIILNQIVEKPRAHVANFICLITKRYIYCQKCLKGCIHFPSLIALINHTEIMEKYIAVKNGKLSGHRIKWCQKNEH